MQLKGGGDLLSQCPLAQCSGTGPLCHHPPTTLMHPIFIKEVWSDNVHNSLTRFSHSLLVEIFKVWERAEAEWIEEKRDFPPFYEKLYLDTQGILLPSDEMALYAAVFSGHIKKCSYSVRLILRVFFALVHIEYSAVCENAGSQKANLSKIATATMAAATIMSDPTCPAGWKKDTLKWLKCSPHTPPQTDEAKPNWGVSGKTHMGVCVILTNSQLVIEFARCEMLSFLMVWDAETPHLDKNLSGKFSSLAPATKAVLLLHRLRSEVFMGSDELVWPQVTS